MKTARQILLTIGYVILISFFSYSIYYSVNILNDALLEASSKILSMVVIIGTGGAVYGVILLLALVTLILNFKLRKEGFNVKLILDVLLVILAIIFEIILVLLLLLV